MSEVRYVIILLLKELRLPSNLVIPYKWVRCNSKYAECLFYNLNDIRINLSSKTIDNPRILWSSIAHEMRHVEQFYSRRLIVSESKLSFLWEERRHFYKKWEYSIQPFEIEAKQFELTWTENNFEREYKKWLRLKNQSILNFKLIG